ncbi:Hint domain-containing protein [Celeribacter indicus]|uniref:Hemolysin-type calcium-binding repeat family protein n=1 Tax=Celeribacter indicus TaxID=1208324 RepID=A0A0B5E1L7_9RHOB|nr:Hint domain-containing protein [Celeribacter indicus]AJE47295.1 hemolysin-type calcium-binding repeat family protein [Celeribacter indicus]SDW02702.1 Ca2+-binding protein, RTX toxin-related [Celeribacter indicus]
MTRKHHDCDPAKPEEPSGTNGIVEGTAGNDVIDTAYTGDPDGDMIDGTDGLDDVVYAGGGDDRVEAGAGNDVVYGDSAVETTRASEVFSWAHLPDQDHRGSGAVDNGEDLEGLTLRLDTGAVTVSVTTPDTYDSFFQKDIGVDSNFSTTRVNTDGVEGADKYSSLKSYAKAGESGTYNVSFSTAVENVAFNISDIDANIGRVTIVAYDSEGREIPVSFDAGHDLKVTGGTVTARTYDDASPAADSNTVTVSIAGPVSSFKIIHSNPGHGQSGVHISDIAYDVTTGDTVVPGEAGDDTLIGGAGDDILYGEGGNDTLQGDGGTNLLDGGTGDDTFIGGAGADSFIGGPGQDNLDYSASGAGVTVDLDKETLSGGDAENDTIISGIDGAIGSEYDDTLIGFNQQGKAPEDTYTNQFWGMGGNDFISGAGGDDYLDGGAGNDTIHGGAGNDTIIGGGFGLPDRGYPGLFDADADPEDDKDTLYGGAGNDLIYGGDDDDFIDGGDGNDTIYGGNDDDEIYGGKGDDFIVGGEGSDHIEGGDGNDTIYGGIGPVFDEVNIADDAGDLVPDNGIDYIDGGAGNDTIYGQDDRDVILGGSGNDYLDGGLDDDELYGGEGDDRLFGGQGNDKLVAGAGHDQLDGGTGDDILIGGGDNDVLSGGDDQDRFIIDFSGVTSGVYNTTVHGGAGGVDYDTLDLSGLLSNGWVITHSVQNPDSDGNGHDGQIMFYNQDLNAHANLNYTNIENVIPCFTPGTLIATPRGEVAVEDLRVGDKAITRDNGLQRIRWIGRRTLSAEALAAQPGLRPVLIRQGALGAGLPERDMLVSPNHRMLVSNEKAALLFEEHEVLVAAKHLTRIEGIDTVDVASVTYVHVMFDRHEVVLSDGCWSESFQPGDYTLDGIDAGAREEIFALFPELRDVDARGSFTAARRVLRKHEAELLVS